LVDTGCHRFPIYSHPFLEKFDQGLVDHGSLEGLVDQVSLVDLIDQGTLEGLIDQVSLVDLIDQGTLEGLFDQDSFE